MVTNKLYLDDGTDEYIILCKFGSHAISGYSVTGVGPPKGPPPHCPRKRKIVKTAKIYFQNFNYNSRRRFNASLSQQDE